jgi:hypothetical protein
MIAVTVSVAAVAAESTKPSKGQLALDALKAGGAVGSLVFTEIKYSPQVSEAQINKFVRLAQRIEHDVALSRGSERDEQFAARHKYGSVVHRGR